MTSRPVIVAPSCITVVSLPAAIGEKCGVLSRSASKSSSVNRWRRTVRRIPAQLVQGVRLGQVDGLQDVGVEDGEARAEDTKAEADSGGHAGGKQRRSAEAANGVAKVGEHGGLIGVSAFRRTGWVDGRGRRNGSVMKTTLDLTRGPGVESAMYRSPLKRPLPR